MDRLGCYTKAKLRGIAGRFYIEKRMPARLYYICCHTDVYHDIEIPVTYVLLLLSDDDVEITSVPLQCYQT